MKKSRKASLKFEFTKVYSNCSDANYWECSESLTDGVKY